jgi:hypothetical protein
MRGDPSNHDRIVEREREAKRPTVHPLTIQPPLRPTLHNSVDDDCLSRYTTWVSYYCCHCHQCLYSTELTRVRWDGWDRLMLVYEP